MSGFDYSKPEFVAPLRDAYVHVVCGGLTTMTNMTHVVITYATNPDFYDSTFCAACKKYFPLVLNGKCQFVWDDDATPVGETHGEPGKDRRNSK